MCRLYLLPVNKILPNEYRYDFPLLLFIAGLRVHFINYRLVPIVARSLLFQTEWLDCTECPIYDDQL